MGIDLGLVDARANVNATSKKVEMIQGEIKDLQDKIKNAQAVIEGNKLRMGEIANELKEWTFKQEQFQIQQNFLTKSLDDLETVFLRQDAPNGNPGMFNSTYE